METDFEQKPGLFYGAYSYREAARLLGVSSQRVVRWADGYSYKLKYAVGRSKPVLQTNRISGVLTFGELIELMFVKEYVGFGVALQQVRQTAERLSDELGPYPFSRANLFVQGRILLNEYAEGILMRPDIGQLMVDYADGLRKRVELQEEWIGRYIPPDFQGCIYLDRQIRAGEPVIKEFAIPTRTIFNLWEMERDIEAVMDYHDISKESVLMAIRYEAQWRQAA